MIDLIRTLLVDDSSEFLEAAQRFLNSDPQIEICGILRSGQEAVDAVKRLHPDLVLMDLAMPGMNGLAATRQIKALADPPLVIILTLYDHAEYRLASEAVDADDFITKSEFGSELLPLIHRLFPGEMVPEPEESYPART